MTAANEPAPRVLGLPVGLLASGTRRETDSLGAIDVPADRYWAPRRNGSLIHFSIGDDRMPKAVYHAYGQVKKAAAIVNGQAGRLPAWKTDLIQRVSDEVIAGKLDEHFPLYVWQTGSGTQSNIEHERGDQHRAIQLVGGQLGSKTPIHPNDHVNMGQSSNDTFPTAMHIAAVESIEGHLLPSVGALQRAIQARAERWRGVVKIGRTHLQDAVPLTVGQEWSGYAHQLAQAVDRVSASAEGLYELAAGGTAVGTGLNAPEGSARRWLQRSRPPPAVRLPQPRISVAAQGGLDAMVGASAGLRAPGRALMKIANESWLASGRAAGWPSWSCRPTKPGS